MTDGKKLKTLIVQGVKYKTSYTKKFENRVFWETPNQNQIYSFIPGTIIDVLVKTGQKVKEGETLLILEAMKMHNLVKMPFNGKIIKIHVRKDMVIPKKHLMIEIKSD